MKYVRELNGNAILLIKYQRLKNGSLRIVEHTNLAYVEPHRVIIDNINYLFFNEHNYFYIGSLSNKYAISDFRKIIGN